MRKKGRRKTRKKNEVLIVVESLSIYAKKSNKTTEESGMKVVCLKALGGRDLQNLGMLLNDVLSGG